MQTLFVVINCVKIPIKLKLPLCKSYLNSDQQVNKKLLNYCLYEFKLYES